MVSQVIIRIRYGDIKYNASPQLRQVVFRIGSMFRKKLRQLQVACIIITIVVPKLGHG